MLVQTIEWRVREISQRCVDHRMNVQPFILSHLWTHRSSLHLFFSSWAVSQGAGTVHVLHSTVNLTDGGMHGGHVHEWSTDKLTILSHSIKLEMLWELMRLYDWRIITYISSFPAQAGKVIGQVSWPMRRCKTKSSGFLQESLPMTWIHGGWLYIPTSSHSQQFSPQHELLEKTCKGRLLWTLHQSIYDWWFIMLEASRILLTSHFHHPTVNGGNAARFYPSLSPLHIVLCGETMWVREVEESSVTLGHESGAVGPSVGLLIRHEMLWITSRIPSKVWTTSDFLHNILSAYLPFSFWICKL